MALFGRDTPRDLDRVERFKRFAAARTPYALISPAAGLMAMLEFWTLVLGVIAGIGAIITGRLGLRDLRTNPQLLGKRLCVAGIVMGTLGLLLTAAMWVAYRT